MGVFILPGGRLRRLGSGVSEIVSVAPGFWTTAARALERLRPDVQWCLPREKPVLTQQHRRERLAVCTEWQKKPAKYFTEQVDVYIDNKIFAVPTHKGAIARLRMGTVRGHLRSRAEG